MQTRDGRWVRTGPGVMPGPPDSYIAYGRNWANVSNTPFRQYKHFVHEGGIATPLIAHWPAGIEPGLNGKIESQPGHLIDVMATCVDVSGAAYPKAFKGETIQPMEGVSLRPLLAGKPFSRTNALFWEHEGNRAVRSSPWKLVARAGQAWELYNMDEDRTEMHDLAVQNAALVSRLSADWQAWAERSHVLPLGAWRKPANAGEKGTNPTGGK